MKIKSLLLGSAAALVAVSGARAADAVIIPEPEVVEYVRVCDAYGTGYFYIPGTETCMKIHGYVRFDVGFGDLKGVTAASNIFGPGDETYNIRSRMSLRVSTANETDYGTLRTYFEGRYQWDTNSDTATSAGTGVVFPPATGYTNTNEFSINFAYIDLNGFRVGKDESYFTTFTGYAGGVINDTDAGGYGPFDTNLISYTWSGGAFSAGISLEQGVDNAIISGPPGFPGNTGWGIDDYAPHVVLGLGYDAGVVNIRGVVAFDTRDDDFFAWAGPYYAGGWAGKIRVDADITDSLSGFIMVGYGENNSAYTTWANGSPPVFDDDTWTIIGGATFVFNDTLRANGQIQWVESGLGDIDDQYAIAANVNYNLTPRYVITPEIAWLNRFDGTDDFGGTLRFQASF